MRMPDWARVLLLILAAGSAAWTQDTACLQRTIPVAVTDSRGYAFTDLNPEDLQGEVAGKPTRVLSLKKRADPALMILLDVSVYMHNRPLQWEHAWGLAFEAARSMPRPSPLVLVLFTNQIYATVQGHDRVLERLLAIKVGPPDAPDSGSRDGPLYTVDQVLDRIASPRMGDVIYLITGYSDNVATDLQHSLRARFASLGIRLFATVVQPVDELYRPPGSRRTTGSPSDSDRFMRTAWLRTLALESGGDFYLDLGNATLNVINWQLQERMTPVLEVSLELPSSSSKMQPLKLRLNGDRSRGVTLYYPQQIAPCPTQTK